MKGEKRNLIKHSPYCYDVISFKSECLSTPMSNFNTIASFTPCIRDYAITLLLMPYELMRRIHLPSSLLRKQSYYQGMIHKQFRWLRSLTCIIKADTGQKHRNQSSWGKIQITSFTLFCHWCTPIDHFSNRLAFHRHVIARNLQSH